MEMSAAEKFAQSLCFEVQAVPQRNADKAKSSDNMTPFNVKIRIRKRNDFNDMQLGVYAIPKQGSPKSIPERLRLASSDQTIMSFNMLMENGLEKKSHKKNRIPFFSGCFGSQVEDDDSAYMPCTSDKDSRSDNGVLRKQKLSKNVNYDNISNTSQGKEKVLFGKCKPGGCLDPPFGEERYVYRPISYAYDQTAPATKYHEFEIKKLKRDKTSESYYPEDMFSENQSIEKDGRSLEDSSNCLKEKNMIIDLVTCSGNFSPDSELDKWKNNKLDIPSRDKPLKQETVAEKTILNLYSNKTKITLTKADSAYSHTSTAQINEVKTLPSKVVESSSSNDNMRNSFSEFNTTYFNPPKREKIRNSRSSNEVDTITSYKYDKSSSSPTNEKMDNEQPNKTLETPTTIDKVPSDFILPGIDADFKDYVNSKKQRQSSIFQTEDMVNKKSHESFMQTSETPKKKEPETLLETSEKKENHESPLQSTQIQKIEHEFLLQSGETPNKNDQKLPLLTIETQKRNEHESLLQTSETPKKKEHEPILQTSEKKEKHESPLQSTQSQNIEQEFLLQSGETPNKNDQKLPSQTFEPPKRKEYESILQTNEVQNKKECETPLQISESTFPTYVSHLLTSPSPFQTSESLLRTSESRLETSEPPKQKEHEYPLQTNEISKIKEHGSPLQIMESPMQTRVSPLLTSLSPLQTRESLLRTSESPLDTSEPPKQKEHEYPLQTNEIQNKNDTDSPLRISESPLQTLVLPVPTSPSPLQTSKSLLRTSESPLQISEPLKKTEYESPLQTNEIRNKKEHHSPLQISESPVQTYVSPLLTRTSPLQTSESLLRRSESSMETSNPLKKKVYESLLQTNEIPNKKECETQFLKTQGLQGSESPFQTYGSPILTSLSPLQTSESLLRTSESPSETNEPQKKKEQKYPLQTNEISKIKEHGSPLQIMESPLQTRVSPLLTSLSPLQTSESLLRTSESPLETSEPPKKKVHEPPLQRNEISNIKEHGSPLQKMESPLHTSKSPLQTSESPLQTIEPQKKKVHESPLQISESPLQTLVSPLHTSEYPFPMSESPLRTSESPFPTSQSPLQTTEPSLIKKDNAGINLQHKPNLGNDQILNPKTQLYENNHDLVASSVNTNSNFLNQDTDDHKKDNFGPELDKVLPLEQMNDRTAFVRERTSSDILRKSQHTPSYKPSIRDTELPKDILQKSKTNIGGDNADLDKPEDHKYESDENLLTENFIRPYDYYPLAYDEVTVTSKEKLAQKYCDKMEDKIFDIGKDSLLSTNEQKKRDNYFEIKSTGILESEKNHDLPDVHGKDLIYSGKEPQINFDERNTPLDDFAFFTETQEKRPEILFDERNKLHDKDSVFLTKTQEKEPRRNSDESNKSFEEDATFSTKTQQLPLEYFNKTDIIQNTDRDFLLRKQNQEYMDKNKSDNIIHYPNNEIKSIENEQDVNIPHLNNANADPNNIDIPQKNINYTYDSNTPTDMLENFFENYQTDSGSRLQHSEHIDTQVDEGAYGEKQLTYNKGTKTDLDSSLDRNSLTKSPVTQIHIPPDEIEKQPSYSTDLSSHFMLDEKDNPSTKDIPSVLQEKFDGSVTTTGDTDNNLGKVEAVQFFKPKIITNMYDSLPNDDIESQQNIYDETDEIGKKTKLQDKTSAHGPDIEKHYDYGIYLDLALQSYAYENNKTILRSLDVMQNPSKNVIQLKTFLKPNKEVTVPIDTEYQMSIQITKALKTYGELSKKSFGSVRSVQFDTENYPINDVHDNIDNDLKPTEFTIKKLGLELHETLSTIYEHELVPLQNIMKALKEDIEKLTEQQILYRDKLHAKRSRVTHNPKKCICIKKFV